MVGTGEAKLLIGLVARNLIQIELFLVSNVWSRQPSMRTLHLNPLQFKFTVRTSRDQIFSALQFERYVHGYPALNNCTDRFGQPVHMTHFSKWEKITISHAVG